MRDIIWCFALVAVSAIWAAAWVAVKRIEFGPPTGPEEDEDG